MIPITDIGGHRVFVNCDLIERMTSTPDTLVVLMTGTNILTKDTPEEIVDRIVEFRRRCAVGLKSEAMPPITPPPGDEASDVPGN